MAKNIINQPNTDVVLALIPRVLMAYILLLQAREKFQGYMESMGAWSAITFNHFS